MIDNILYYDNIFYMILYDIVQLSTAWPRAGGGIGPMEKVWLGNKTASRLPCTRSCRAPS